MRRSDDLQEGKASHELAHGGVAGVHAAHQHLGVVTEQLEHGKHGKTAVVELLVGGLKGLLVGLEGLDALGGGEGGRGALGGELVVNEADQEDHLEPAQGGDGLHGGEAVGDGVEGDARGDLAGEAEDLGEDVTQDGHLAHTAVLQLSESVEGERVLVNVLTEAQGVPEASRGLRWCGTANK